MQPRDLSAYDVYQAGRGNEEVARELGMDPEDLIALSSNENPLGASPKAVAAVREAADSINTYPKASHADLIEKLAARWDVAPVQVWLAPGGDGAIDYLHRALLAPGDRVLVPDPGFSYYAMSARYHHGTARAYRIRKAEDFAQTAGAVLDAYDGERIVYLTSPHSPLGTEISAGGVAEIADGTDEETLVVVDEAYGEFTDAPSKAELVRERDDVAVLRTFSKAYGLAGLRLGYLLAPGAWADAYARVNTPFGVNKLACRAGLAALDDDDHVERSVEAVRWAREYMYANLDARTWESAGNFVLADVGEGVEGDEPRRRSTTDEAASSPASAVADACQREGVIVRDCTSFGLPGCIRITCGTREETERAVEVVNRVA
ncbi:histidinol-phosphate transaminase [Halomarina halobia]|uniref:Histidinol-phosphate aminotransferase n=1 Tax=Halomarina halobia TaxID=3033386 RepID=A0ABD6A5D2_9EURY|nr:histidinol-phosphate transaminase [Halomarina sp. PSR21]